MDDVVKKAAARFLFTFDIWVEQRTSIVQSTMFSVFGRSVSLSLYVLFVDVQFLTDSVSIW